MGIWSDTFWGFRVKPYTIKYFLLSAIGSEILNEDARKQDFSCCLNEISCKSQLIFGSVFINSKNKFWYKASSIPIRQLQRKP